MIKKRLAFLVLLSFATEACVSSYTSKLGYRARQAVLRGELDSFDALMSEAAATQPSNPMDNPLRTVLTHFLDFGASDRFFPMIEAWRAKGWVHDNLTCAIHRARYRGLAGKDPIEAARAAGVCLERARLAAEDPDRRWELEACLEQAPFLTESSTHAIARYVDRAADSIEPISFRAALLDGLTRMYLQDPAILKMNDPALPHETAVAKSRAQLTELSARFEWIIGAVKHDPDTALIAGATAFGALELERVHLVHGASLLGRYASSELPADRDLAWGWVRAAKAKKRMMRIEGLGLWNRKREPEYDAFWYLCTGEPKLGATIHVPGISILAKERAADPAAVQRDCVDPRSKSVLPHIAGPFPLEATARGTLTASISRSRGGLPVQVHAGGNPLQWRNRGD